MAKEVEVVLEKSTKINGKFVKAGDTIKVSPEKKDELIKKEIVSDGVKTVVSTDLLKKVKELEAENAKLKAENESLKKEDKLEDKTIEQLKEVAAEKNISLDGITKKDDIIAAILKADELLGKK